MISRLANLVANRARRRKSSMSPFSLEKRYECRVDGSVQPHSAKITSFDLLGAAESQPAMVLIVGLMTEDEVKIVDEYESSIQKFSTPEGHGELRTFELQIVWERRLYKIIGLGVLDVSVRVWKELAWTKILHQETRTIFCICFIECGKEQPLEY